MDLERRLVADVSKSHKRVQFGSRSGLDFSITVQPIPNKFNVLETVIQGLQAFMLLDPENGVRVALLSSTHS